MAMIKCKVCGKDISDKAKACPNCKTVLIEEKKVTCSECGAENNESCSVCTNCGAPLYREELQKVEVAKLPTIGKKKIVLFVVFCIVLATGAGLYLYNSKKQQEKKWVEAYNEVLNEMVDSAKVSEKVAGQIHDVWYNTIYKKADPNTNKFTFKPHLRTKDFLDTYKYSAYDFIFNEDFNDSLSALFSSGEYTSKIKLINVSKDQVSKYISKISKKIPAGKENAYSSMNTLYEDYLKLINLVINPQGSLQTFTNNYNQYNENFFSSLEKAKTFSK